MLDEYPKYLVKYEDLVSYSLPLTENPYILTIEKKNVKFEFLIRLSPLSDKAIVLGSGAFDSSKLSPPIFQRHKWIKSMKGNLVFFNDPTLYLGKMNMGWGQGTVECFYLEEISDMLKLILVKIGIEHHKTLLYGSSAGGFMSLMLGSMIKGASVLVNNSQTIVWNYYESHVESMLSASYPGISLDRIKELFAYRLNVIEFYKMHNYVPPITFLQNTASKRDLTHQLTPFILGLEEIEDSSFSSELKLYLYSDKEKGHSPLDQKKTLKFMEEALNFL